jgi:hypothetical protein
MLTEQHYPASLPRLCERGAPVEEPTSGDVDAVYQGCVRLIRGERLTGVNREGAQVTAQGDSLNIGNAVILFADNAYDLAVMFYSACGCWQYAWDGLRGDS